MMDKIKDNPSYSAIREQLKGANAFRKALKVLPFAGIKNKIKSLIKFQPCKNNGKNLLRLQTDLTKYFQPLVGLPMNR